MSYSYAGVSKLNGKIKARFANDQLRVKVLAKNGHKDIDIVQLKHPMSKIEAIDYLLSIDFDNGNKEVRAALEAAKEARSETPAKASKPAVKGVMKAKKGPTMDAIKAKAQAVKAKAAKVAVPTESEDAPF